MKSWLFLAVLSLAAAGCSSDAEPEVEPEPPPGPPEPMTVMTFNVLCSFCDSSFDPWDERLAYFADIFERHDPDIIGLQELAFAVEIDQILTLLPTHDAAFYRNADTDVVYPDATVVYRRDRFELLEHGEYWLSPTPEEPSSTGFAPPQLPRLVTWVVLEDKKSRRKLYFATTHFDNNAPSQELSAPLVLERIDPWQAEMPVILVGDFNSSPPSEAYQILTTSSGDHPPLTNSFDLSADWSVTHNQASEPTYDLDQRIDHMFVAPNPDGWTADDWTVDLYRYGDNELPASDHDPMAVRLTGPE